MNAKKIYKKNCEVLKNFEKKFDENKKFAKKILKKSGKNFKNSKKNASRKKFLISCQSTSRFKNANSLINDPLSLLPAPPIHPFQLPEISDRRRNHPRIVLHDRLCKIPEDPRFL